MLRTITRIIFLVLAFTYVALSCDTRPRWAHVQGRVVDEAGDPVRFAAVSVQGTHHRAHANEHGQFFIDSVAPGTYTIGASSLGFTPSVKDLAVDGDTVELILELSITNDPLPPGVAYRVPGPRGLRDARAVLPQLVEAEQFSSALASFGSEPVVWAPWAGGLDTTVTLGGRRVRLTGVCSACAIKTIMNVEGGLNYVAGSQHIHLGVTTFGPGRDIMVFCVDPVEPGVSRHIDCSSIRSPHAVRYMLRADGSWRSVP